MRYLLTCLVVGACADAVEAPGDVPVTDAELLAFCQDGSYLEWAAEPEVHDGAGPHFGDVRTFANAELADSSGDAHPLGSAAIKELYGDGTTVLGWTVMVKVAEDGTDDDWYWWEWFEDSTLADGTGLGVCVGCHGAGVDFVLTDLTTLE